MKKFPLSQLLSADADLEICNAVIAYINGEMEEPGLNCRSFDRHVIARAIGADPELVGEALMAIDASDNGITVCKGE
jgi:hypothetical protein